MFMNPQKAIIYIPKLAFNLHYSLIKMLLFFVTWLLITII